MSSFDQRSGRKCSWNNRRRPSRRKEVATLPVEVITPTSAAVAISFHCEQRTKKVADRGLGFFSLDSSMIRDLREREQRDSLRVTLLGHTNHVTKIRRRSLYELSPDEARVARLGQRCRLKDPAV